MNREFLPVPQKKKYESRVGALLNNRLLLIVDLPSPMLLGLELTIPQIGDPTFIPQRKKKKKKKPRLCIFFFKFIILLWILRNKKNKQNKFIQMHIKD